MGLLESLRDPEMLRALPRAQLRAVSDEVREAIVAIVAAQGGHFSSNLGTVELAVALHYVFDTPRDKLVWDVGHQAYPHKILTGRLEQLSTIRKKDGLSGFTSRAESVYDCFGAGHASTSISAATGIAEALRMQGLGKMAVAIIGDGSLTGGLAYEGLNNAGHVPSKNLLVILNDNAMSIDPNVGALSKFVNQTVIHPGYNRLRREMRTWIDGLAEAGLPLSRLASKFRRGLKGLFTPGILFECFGFRYLGPVDGHDIEALVDTLQFIRKEGPEGGPYFLHALTVKGKGYPFAEENSLKYHGVGPFCPTAGIQAGSKKKPNYQDLFADTLVRLAKEDPRVVAITAAMPSGTGLSKFQREIPERFYDVGIAEAHAVVFAAGLATENVRPVAAIYSTFLQRAFDAVIHDVALQKLPVIFAMDRAGLVGADGATHQGAFDLSYLRTIPNMVLMAPKDENELQHMMKTAIDYESGPIAFRYPRGEVVGVPMDAEPRALPIGKGELLELDGDIVDVAIIAIGAAVQTSFEVARRLRERSVRCAVVNARFVKPLDRELLLRVGNAARLVVTIEENAVRGGFGSAVLELFQEAQALREIQLFGLPDVFIDHATPAEQLVQCGLDAPSITNAITARLEQTWEGSTDPSRRAPRRIPSHPPVTTLQ